MSPERDEEVTGWDAPAEQTIVVQGKDIHRGALPIYDADYLDRLYSFDFEDAGLVQKVEIAMQDENVRLLAAVGEAMKECLIEARLIMPIRGKMRANDSMSRLIRRVLKEVKERVEGEGGDLNSVDITSFVRDYALVWSESDKENFGLILENAHLANVYAGEQYSVLKARAAHRAKVRELTDTADILSESLGAAEESARMDELTGLPNRKGLAYFLKEIQEAQEGETETEFAVVWLDGDHFKKVNDNWGHPAGDHVLREMANVLKEQGWDFVARMGGEEFVLIRKLEDGEDLQEIGNKIRHDIGAKVMSFTSMQGLPITYHQKVSVGVAAGSAAELHNWDLIARADRVSFHSKAEGRDRTTVYEHGVAYKTPAVDPNR